HPWTFQRSGRDILSKIKEVSDKTLGDIAESIGFDVISGQDSVFVQFITESFICRNKLERDILIPCLGGANVRNWTVDWHGNRKSDSTYAIYTLDSLGEPINIETFPNVGRFLRTHKEALEARPDGWQRQPISETDTRWYIVFKRLYQVGIPKIVFPDVATHSHFSLDAEGRYIAKTSCRVMYFPRKNDLDFIKIILGFLNSSVMNYFIKQISSKMSGSVEEKARFRFQTQFLEDFPLPTIEANSILLSHVDEMLSLADRAMELSMYNLVRKEDSNSVSQLLERRQAYIDEYRSVQARMKDIQNETDHLVYKIYGITDPEDIAELEQPLYKRPWKEPDWDKEFEFEAQDYVNDLIEEIFAKQRFPNELPISSQDIGSFLAANPKAEALRGAYYHGGPQPMAVFAKECMDTDCRTIPFDEEAVKVGRGTKKVDILHERFFRFDELDKELYGWTGWSPEGQLNVFLRLAQRASSEGKSPEPFKKWVESRVLRDIEDERTREQTMAYLGRL
ncbi:MAG: TaqI-like C-terminal specificity domain-containing protein, partial [Candidatus Poribacteria bacterium]